MHPRFALLIAAAVIFAPGSDEQGVSQHPPESNLAARVLAPTVDEGAVRETAADLEHQLGGWQAKRWPSSSTLEAVLAFGLGALALAILGLVTSYSGRPVGNYQLRFRFSRAPPHLQPA